MFVVFPWKKDKLTNIKFHNDYYVNYYSSPNLIIIIFRRNVVVFTCLKMQCGANANVTFTCRSLYFFLLYKGITLLGQHEDI